MAQSYYYKATDSYQCTLPSQEQFFKYTTHRQTDRHLHIFRAFLSMCTLDATANRFPTGQLERHYPSGAKSIVFSNGTLKRIHHDGSEVIEYVTKRTSNQHAG